MTGLVLAMVLCGPPKAPPRVPASHAESAAWVLDAKVAGPARLDQPAALLIQVDARAGYHVNADYPHNFRPTTGGEFERQRLDVGEGVALAPCSEDKAQMCHATVKAKFTPRSVGSLLVGGTFAFSTCNEEHCLIDKIDVVVGVDVAK